MVLLLHFSPCPIADCGTACQSDDQIQEHLYETHHIQDLSVDISNKDQPHVKEEQKVPPLRVKLSDIPSKSTKVIQCSQCSFQTKNAFILGKHEKACLKRRQSEDLDDVGEVLNCQQCGFHTKQASIMKRHEKVCIKDDQSMTQNTDVSQI